MPIDGPSSWKRDLNFLNIRILMLKHAHMIEQNMEIKIQPSSLNYWMLFLTVFIPVIISSSQYNTI